MLGIALGTTLGMALGEVVGNELRSQLLNEQEQNLWDGGYRYLVSQSPVNPDSVVGYVQ